MTEHTAEEIHAWREALKPGDPVFSIYRGSFSNSSRFRRGRVLRRTPTLIVVEISSSPMKDKTRRFRASTGYDIHSAYYLWPDNRGLRPAHGETA